MIEEMLRGCLEAVGWRLQTQGPSTPLRMTGGWCRLCQLPGYLNSVLKLADGRGGILDSVAVEFALRISCCAQDDSFLVRGWRLLLRVALGCNAGRLSEWVALRVSTVLRLSG